MHDSSPQNAQTQRGQILAVLREASGAWVPLPRILELGIAQYNARIFELRRAGFKIENRTEVAEGERRSCFRLVLTPAVPAESVQSQPLPNQFERRHREDLERETPLFANEARP
jgi:hypothetical protein